MAAATIASASSSPLLRVVLNSMRRLYPEHLADRSWDNTGLLLEPFTCRKHEKQKVLLTIDLTQSVAAEAIDTGASVIITYHPIIFRPLTSITTSNSQQRTLLRLAENGISVYSPHTAVDAAVGGVNDWLAEGIAGGLKGTESRSTITNCEGVEGTEYEGAGMGRLVTLKEPTEIGTLVNRVKEFLGMKHVLVAIADKHKEQQGNFQARVKTVGICAGSGGSILRKVKADLLFTGEMSHHEALAAVESGTSVISCLHSNTERGFLEQVMKPKLEAVIVEEARKLAAKEKDTESVEHVEVVVSQADQDPYTII